MINAYRKTRGVSGTLGRETRAEVIPVLRLRSTYKRRNPSLSRATSDLVVEELAVFDLLTELDPAPLPGDEERVKQVARDLLGALKREKLVLDWRKRQQARPQVRVAMEEVLDRGLPHIYAADLYCQKSDSVYQHFVGAYAGLGRSIDATAGEGGARRSCPQGTMVRGWSVVHSFVAPE